MRLFIIGANGKTGTELIDLGLRRGHQLTAFVRSPEKVRARHPRLEVVRGDPKNPDQLAAALPGHHAVLSAIGVRARDAFRPGTLVEECTVATLSACKRAAVDRFVIVSAATLFPERALRFRIVKFILKHQIADLVRAEAHILASPLAFTIARPPRLLKNAEERYRAASGALPPSAWSMSFRAVAAFMLDCTEQDTHRREIVGLAG
jgi:putative NADH-flavin reductase